MGSKYSRSRSSPNHFVWKSPKRTKVPKIIDEDSVSSVTPETPDVFIHDAENDNVASSERDSYENKRKFRNRKRRNEIGLNIKSYDPVQHEDTLKITKMPTLTKPEDILVHNETELIYVTDSINNCVYAFSQDQLAYQFHFPRWELRPSNNLLKTPIGMMIMNNMIFITESKRGEIALFTLTGDYIGRIDKTFLKEHIMRLKNPAAIATDSQGQIYVCDSLNARIMILSEELIPICLQFGRKVLSKPTGIQVNKRNIIVLDEDREGMSIKIFNMKGCFVKQIRYDFKVKMMNINDEKNIYLSVRSDQSIIIEDVYRTSMMNQYESKEMDAADKPRIHLHKRIVVPREMASNEYGLKWVTV